VRSQLWWSLGSLAVVLGAYWVRGRFAAEPARRPRATGRTYTPLQGR
jgi:hypothetical protein